VETVGKHRVVAERQKAMVQCLGDLGKCSAADVMLVGRRHNRDGELHGCKVPEEELALTPFSGHGMGTSPCLLDASLSACLASRKVSSQCGCLHLGTREMVLMSGILSTGLGRRSRYGGRGGGRRCCRRAHRRGCGGARDEEGWASAHGGRD